MEGSCGRRPMTMTSKSSTDIVTTIGGPPDPGGNVHRVTSSPEIADGAQGRTGNVSGGLFRPHVADQRHRGRPGAGSVMTTPLRRNTPLQRGHVSQTPRMARITGATSHGSLQRSTKSGGDLGWPAMRSTSRHRRARWLVVVVADRGGQRRVLAASAALPRAVRLAGRRAWLHALTSRTELDMPPLAFRLGQALVGAVIGALVKLPTLARLAVRLASVRARHRRHARDQPGRRPAAGPAPRRLPRHRRLRADRGRRLRDRRAGPRARRRRPGGDDRAVPAGAAGAAGDAAGHHACSSTRRAASGRWRAARPAGARTCVFVVPSRWPPACCCSGSSGPRRPRCSARCWSRWRSPRAGCSGTVAVPTALEQLGYALIGVRVGLRFTRASLRSIARLLPLATALIVAVIVACALLGLLLSRRHRGRPAHGVPRHHARRAVRGAGHRRRQRVGRHLRARRPGDPGVRDAAGRAAAGAGGSVEAELVPLGILHHEVAGADPARARTARRAPRPGRPAAPPRPRAPPSGPRPQPGRGPHVEVHPVLGGLALRDLLEEQPRPARRRGRAPRWRCCALRRDAPGVERLVPGREPGGGWSGT